MSDEQKPKREIILKHGNRHSSTVHAARSPEEKLEANRRKAEKQRATRQKNKDRAAMRDLFDMMMMQYPESVLSVAGNASVIQWLKAMAGDTSAYIAVMDRVVGKPVEKSVVKQETKTTFTDIDTVSDEEFDIIAKTYIKNDDENDND